ncbi:N-6 DNA methylase [Agrobacterium sp. LAD9]|uniref:N-6 DNA methylase n=1 Tax=Agrobacterium sp. LAD9 TaxID=2055153 RepID=UPI000D1DA7F8|nr:N-6 DNA methylase [Agrobacterium sp. LAD9]
MTTRNRVQAIVMLFERCQYKHDLYAVFSDWCECAAIALSNTIDLRNRDKREARYLEIVKRYDRYIIDIFPEILGQLQLAFEAGSADVLGQVFHSLELHNKARGQFFTPYSLCQLMARMTIDPEVVKRTIDERGYMTAHEPAVGAGAMIIALAEAMRDAGFNYQRQLHVMAVDIDRRAVHMAYIQFFLMHIPAVVIEGDTLRMEFRDEWFTGSHILDGWGRKLMAEVPENETVPVIAGAGDLRGFETALPLLFTTDKRGQLSFF